jgi:hypothetical protein
MVFLLALLALMVISTVLVVAAGMLSSRLSRQEGRIETFDEVDAAAAEMTPQTTE